MIWIASNLITVALVYFAQSYQELQTSSAKRDRGAKSRHQMKSARSKVAPAAFNVLQIGKLFTRCLKIPRSTYSHSPNRRSIFPIALIDYRNNNIPSIYEFYLFQFTAGFFLSVWFFFLYLDRKHLFAFSLVVRFRYLCLQISAVFDSIMFDVDTNGLPSISFENTKSIWRCPSFIWISRGSHFK